MKGHVADRVMRVVVIGALAGLVALVGLRVAELLDDPPKPELAALRSDENSVADALVRRPENVIIVRGYVFAGDGFPVRVCNGILRESPPKCVGPFLELRNLDPSRVPVRRQESVIWSPETVGFLGRVDQDRFVVQELLN